MSEYSVAIITVSDRSARGQREDLSGPRLAQLMEDQGYKISYSNIVADEIEDLKAELIALADRGLNLVLTTGGTGFGPRDISPEATSQVCQRMTPGISELMRAYSSKYTTKAYLSRAVSGIRDRTLIINLPGSPKAMEENLQAILPILDHGLDMLAGGDH